MARQVTAGHLALRKSEHPDNSALEREKSRLDEEYGEPCDECQVRVAREVPIHPGSDEIEYPAGSHAIGCPNAEEGSFHPRDPRAD